MSDPQLHVAVDVDGGTVGLDAVVPKPEQETWLVKPSQPRWEVWRDHNRRRPPSRAEKRGRVAAALTGTIFAVLSIGGLISYAIQWEGLLRDARDQIESKAPDRIVSSEMNSGADIHVAIDRAQGANSESAGLIGIVDDQVAATTPNVVRAAADQGFIKEALKKAEDYKAGSRSPGGYDVYLATHMSWASLCVYATTPITWNDPAVVANVVVLNVFDLTPDRDRINGKYLLYELGSLAGAGAAGGVVRWRLGRRRNSIGEPDEV
jgi:hypothetical protein